jgi:hypothetical protein
MTYQDFLTNCFEELQKLQDDLNKLYDINSYTRYDYDQPSGIITLSKPNQIVNFRYYQVGTYSTELKTWKWSWDNERTSKNVAVDIDKIKGFGITNKYENLINGEFSSYEEIGWELSSICCHLIGGIGVYRPVFEHLNIHMVLTELIDNDLAERKKTKYVDCENHDRRRRAFICQHLKEGSNNGFEESFETYEDMEFEYEDDDFVAWCNECEKVRVEEDSLSGRCWEEGKFKIVCEKCYFKIKESNHYIN